MDGLRLIYLSYSKELVSWMGTALFPGFWANYDHKHDGVYMGDMTNTCHGPKMMSPANMRYAMGKNQLVN